MVLENHRACILIAILALRHSARTRLSIKYNMFFATESWLRVKHWRLDRGVEGYSDAGLPGWVPFAAVRSTKYCGTSTVGLREPIPEDTLDLWDATSNHPRSQAPRICPYLASERGGILVQSIDHQRGYLHSGESWHLSPRVVMYNEFQYSEYGIINISIIFVRITIVCLTTVSK